MATKKKVTIDVNTGANAEAVAPANLAYDESGSLSVVEETAQAAEQQLTEHQQAILEHYGPNSAEFAEAMRGE